MSLQIPLRVTHAVLHVVGTYILVIQSAMTTTVRVQMMRIGRLLDKFAFLGEIFKAK